MPILGSDEVKLVYEAKYSVKADTTGSQTFAQKESAKPALKKFLKGSHYVSQGLYIWFYITNNAGMADILCRTVAPVYCFLLILLMGRLLWSRGGWTCIWGLAFLLSIPLLIHKTIGNSQDPGNLYLLILTLAWLAQALEEKHGGYYILFFFVLILSLLAARINYLLLIFIGASIVVVTLAKIKRGKIFISVLILALLTVFTVADITQKNKTGNGKEIIEKNIFRAANNYYANKDLMNEIQDNSENEFQRLLKEKYALLKRLFKKSDYNIIPFTAIVGVLIWSIYMPRKPDIDFIILSSMLSYIFLIAFNDSQFFTLSAIYLSKIRSNKYFLVYNRYLLITTIMMAYFSAIFFGKLFDTVKNRWIKWGISIVFILILISPIEKTLLNKKQSLGIDDWTKILTGSEYEKLIRYREGYGQIIKYIKENVKDNEIIMTPTRYKFIPYYSEKICLDAENFLTGKAIKKKSPEKLFRLLKENGVAYILPTEKGRVYSYIEETPFQKVIRDIAYAYVAFDNSHWRMYKLRDEVKKTIEIPVIIPNGNFEKLNGNHPLNWNVYGVNTGSVIDPKNINWGIIAPKKQFKRKAVYIENPGSQTSYLYTGPGDFRYPPSHYGSGNYKLENSTNYLVKYSVKGSRPVAMNFWLIEYDKSGNIKWNLKEHMLNMKFAEMIASFNTGDNAREYRIAFHVFDDVRLSVKEVSVIKKAID